MCGDTCVSVFAMIGGFVNLDEVCDGDLGLIIFVVLFLEKI